MLLSEFLISTDFYFERVQYEAMEISRYAQRRKISSRGEELEYESFGEEPTAMFIAGIHGDERRVIGRMRSHLSRAMINYPKLLGNILRIFHTNPEAVRAGTRGMKELDLDRQFLKEDISNPRALLLTDLLNEFPDLEFIFSFHEDTLWKAPKDTKLHFYVYDIPPTDHEEDQTEVTKLCRKLTEKVEEVFGSDIVLTGIDDEELQICVEDGYVMTAAENYNVGDFESYAVEMGRLGKNKIKRSFIFEIPTDFPIEQKDRMVAIIINELVVPFLKSRKPKH